ncbi:ATP-binding protein [Deinococcus yavapaiensis]|uniref:DNA-binding SARP family transcriptional activator n=1 Tax=Deinococcus yavapaiensis KR-236 TaxID=694435 RepID=A0A318S6K8_9DEIO|nr:BTAD domain-containing putative transcriptional regulator [Deinococcus yavapaiensis]PYE54404.1 DNA-binding SARP family transcriptional activator [Deinococcus yavapaiensis KR-236]
MTASSWHVRLLGVPHLDSDAGATLVLERKAAALLAYLALEGPTRRAQLTELLWPDTREAAARNNLVHLLRKLRSATSAELVEGAEVLTLAEDASTDVKRVWQAFEEGRYEDVLASDGELLQGSSYDDCLELHDWIALQQERLRERRLTAWRDRSDRAERDGRFDEALRHASALLDLDVLSEDAWRRVMRLHYLRGDRPASLKAYHKCKDVLERELGVEPLPETKELARLVSQGRVEVPSVARTDIPLSVLRPPVLVGREGEWASLEEAWQAGKFIFLSGEPGVGKSRLALDFASSKGEYHVLEGRPGDTNQPGASSARAFRTLLNRHTDLPLEPWVRLEMSRYLPELAEAGEAPPPLTNHLDVLRFRQAMGVFALATNAGITTMIVDDWQFFDDVSVEDGMSFFGGAYPLGQPGGMPRVIATLRTGETSEANLRLLEQLVQGGMALHIELRPLAPESRFALLEQVGVPGEGELRSRLASYAGGNPLFLLETVKHLIESNQLASGLPERLLPSGRVGDLIARRLARLSTTALQTARAAAVLQRDFSVELVADVLGAPLLDTATAWEELEAAQITRGERFSHDLVYEAVDVGMPDTVRRLLHRSAARVLPRYDAAPSRVARHWLRGGDFAKAADWLSQAAVIAEASAQFREATMFFEEAAGCFETNGDVDAARSARDAAARTARLVLVDAS